MHESILTVVIVCLHCGSSWASVDSGHLTYFGMGLKVYSSVVFLVPPETEDEGEEEQGLCWLKGLERFQ